ncbi:hypothetical protein Pcac1_g23175 [Phytophthora cactorum]|nr:hypothetical protein Pcac1_g23175 [Phytophthora cactorum]
MSSFLRKDLMWWNELVFQNEFAGLPMELFEKNSGYDEAWPIVTDSKKITLTSMRSENAQCSASTLRIRRVKEKRDQLKQASIPAWTLGKYSKNFKFCESFCNDFEFPVWIYDLPRTRQARMVGPFTTLRASEGHNRAGRGNKFQILTERWQRWHSHTRSFGTPGSITIITEFEIVAKGYKRTLDRKQPVTTPMLLEMRRLLGEADQQDEMMWGSFVLGFFFGTEALSYGDQSQLTAQREQKELIM